MANDNRTIAEQVLEAVGGKDNVTFVTHCITRLRFNLKDNSIPNDDKIKAIKGIIGVNRAGTQYQVIVGQNVEKVYNELCDLGGFKVQEAIDENLDEKKPFEWKNLGSIILDYVSSSLTAIIPPMMAGTMFKMLIAVLGPDMLKVLSPESDLYVLFTFVGDAAFYFFPVLLGFTASKKVGLSPVMGILLGAILIHPTVMSLAGNPFTVYGIPAAMQSYASTILPILLTVWVASYVEKFLKKHIPDSLKIMLVPLMTVAVMLPLMFCVLGPLGGFLGNYICGAIIWFGNVAGPIGAMIIGGLWEFLVMTGMHTLMITQMIMVFSQNGFDPVVSLGAVAASLSVTGMCLGYYLATKDKEKKSLALTNTIAAFIGGVTEPGIYGTGIANKKPIIGMIAGGAAGGLYAGLMGVKAYNMVPVANFIALSAYAGGEGSYNLIQGTISGVIAIVVAAVVTYLLCRKEEK